MNEEGLGILACLEAVAKERETRRADPALLQAVTAVKAYQHQRLARTYPDLLASPRHGKAASFFLEDLYGPEDFTDRDLQFARIVPAMARLLPKDLMHTVARLARLHALSESLDTAMALALRQLTGAGAGDAAALRQDHYAQAWLRTGRRAERLRQIALVRQVGEALDHYTHVPGLRRTLHLMRVPARVAGLGSLHRFLERGFDTFHDMHGATEFLDTIEQRETAFAEALFAAGAASPVGAQ